jgi:chromosome partitioning protein
MRTIAIANHKGGVGKTATVHALGAGLAKLGRRVLLVDIDPQSSLTAACGASANGESLAEVLGGVEPGALALSDILLDVGNGIPLHLAPADIGLAVNELGMIQRFGRESLLQNALATAARAYDVCLIDCPPSLGMLTVNALTAAGAVIIPTQPQISDLRGLNLFLETLARIRQELNPSLEILGILVTFVDGRLIHHQDALNVMQEQGLPLFSMRIGRSVRVAEAAAAGESIITYDPSNKQASNYERLAKDIDQWLRNGQK